MKKESVMNFVDRRIYQNMIDGFPILSIKQDIEIRYKNMSKSILKDVMTQEAFDELLKGDLEKIETSRVKYVAFYVCHAKQRLKDLDWIVANKKKFPQFSTSQIFNLIKLKEKLQPKTELSV
jgi:hypothetical protein